MKIFLTIFVLLFSSSVMSEDISDFEIEGISIGDSLLDYLSREEIVTEIEINKPAYDYLTDEFGEVYLFRKFEIYNHLSFFVKPNDNHYIIYLIKASLLYDDNINNVMQNKKKS